MSDPSSPQQYDDAVNLSGSLSVASSSTAAAAARPPLMARSSSYLLFGSSPKDTSAEPQQEKHEWMPFTLLDVIDTYVDSRLDLIERRWKVHSERLKHKATEVLSKSSANLRALNLKSPKIWPSDLLSHDDDDDDEQTSGRTKKYIRDVDKEVAKFKAKVAVRLNKLTASFNSSRNVHMRDKITFLFGVMSVLSSGMMVGICPDWIPMWWTIQCIFYLPLRAYAYKKKGWHYFLWDMCYFVNILDLMSIWIFPGSTWFFISCYMLTLGPLASAIITWRNSLVFHSFDKVTSLFIHIYPPFTFTIIRHYYPGREERFPAVKMLNESPHWNGVGGFARSMGISLVMYSVWQVAYWRFVIVGRRAKIEAGLRATSFNYMLNDKKGLMGRWLRGFQPAMREPIFMLAQLIYTLICFLPASTLLNWYPLCNSAFLIFVFGVATWNGATYYVDYFGSKNLKELEALRREMEQITSQVNSSPQVNGISSPLIKSRGSAPSDSGESPLILGSSMTVPEFSLDGSPPEAEEYVTIGSLSKKRRDNLASQEVAKEILDSAPPGGPLEDLAENQLLKAVEPERTKESKKDQ